MLFLLFLTATLALDPCKTNNGGCDTRTSCSVAGSYVVCGLCPEGFESNLGDSPCQDIDECLRYNGGCHTLTTCTNTVGSRSCGNCPDGYTGDGETGCIDVNECLTNNGGCSSFTKCYNTRGGRVCGDCPVGYEGTGEAGCTDLNECETNNGGCDDRVICMNNVGSRECGPCPDGFLGNGVEGCYQDKDGDGIPDKEDGTEMETYNHLIERVTTTTARIKTEHLMAQEANARQLVREKKAKETKLEELQALLDRVAQIEQVQRKGPASNDSFVPSVNMSAEGTDGTEKLGFTELERLLSGMEATAAAVPATDAAPPANAAANYDGKDKSADNEDNGDDDLDSLGDLSDLKDFTAFKAIPDGTDSNSKDAASTLTNAAKSDHLSSSSSSSKVTPITLQKEGFTVSNTHLSSLPKLDNQQPSQEVSRSHHSVGASSTPMGHTVPQAAHAATLLGGGPLGGVELRGEHVGNLHPGHSSSSSTASIPRLTKLNAPAIESLSAAALDSSEDGPEGVSFRLENPKDIEAALAGAVAKAGRAHAGGDHTDLSSTFPTLHAKVTNPIFLLKSAQRGRKQNQYDERILSPYNLRLEP